MQSEPVGTDWRLWCGAVVVVLIGVVTWLYTSYTRKPQPQQRAQRTQPQRTPSPSASASASKKEEAGGKGDVVMATVKQLFVYPIKSCKGVAVDASDFDKFGFLFDRNWMVVRDQNYKFISQREYPKIALVTPRFTLTHLEIAAPDMDTFTFPLERDEGPERIIEVELWKCKYPAADAGDAAAEWFSKYLERPCRVVRLPKDHKRQVEKEYAVSGLENKTSFADGYAFLLASTDSLEGIKRGVPSGDSIEINRFRPNILIDLSKGPEAGKPFAEDQWKTITINKETFHLVKPCGRCKMTTINQESGKYQGPEPLQGMQEFRTATALPDEHKKMDGVFFGQNLVQESESGRVAIGDQVRVVARYSQ